MNAEKAKDTRTQSYTNIAALLTEYHLVQRNLFKTLVKSSTMPLTQYHILNMLSQNHNMRMGDISQLMSISRPNLTPLIDKLIALHYVDRIPDSHDRRVTYINITDAGNQALTAERLAIESNVESFCSKLTPEDYECFSESMSNLIKISRKI